MDFHWSSDFYGDKYDSGNKKMLTKTMMFNLDHFISITISVYVFLLGFCLHCLNIDDKVVYEYTIPSIILFMVAGWIA